MAGLDTESATWVRNLPRGYAVLDGPVDPQIIAVPNTTREDVTALLPAASAAFQATLATAAATSPTPNRSGHAVAAEAASEVDAVRRERVLELLRNKVSASKIVREVWGVSGGMPINGRRVSSAKWSRRSWRRWMRDFSTTRGEARSINLVLIERAPFSPNVIAVLYFVNEISHHFHAVNFGRRLFV